MRLAADRPFGNADTAARKLVEIANGKFGPCLPTLFRARPLQRNRKVPIKF
jgi:hypothetical protein